MKLKRVCLVNILIMAKVNNKKSEYIQRKRDKSRKRVNVKDKYVIRKYAGKGEVRERERERIPSQLCIHNWKRYNAHEGGGRSQ